MNYNLFIDETCHLQKDKIPVMSVGYAKVPNLAYEELKRKFIELKLSHHQGAEIKWNKFSKSRLPLYKAVVDFFFDNPIEFRCVLVKYKDRLDHDQFNQGSHDNFYYKMIFYLLRPNHDSSNYKVYLDIKDTRGKEKLIKINEVLNNFYHGKSPFIHFQHLRSHENVFFQITDLFIGAVAYKSRVVNGSLNPNSDKEEFVKYLEMKSGFLLDESTPIWEEKFNIFDFIPRKIVK